MLQNPLDQAKNLGIRSESDLKKFGVLQSEIDRAKAEMLNTNSTQVDDKTTKKISSTSDKKLVKKQVIKF